MKIINFYKYVLIKEPEKLISAHKEFCLQHNLKGSIYFAHEGINAMLSGDEAELEEYKKFLQKDLRFREIHFKEDEIKGHPFKRMKVKLKKEICSFKGSVDLKNTGERVKPKELDKWIDGGEELVIMDNRNNYEAKEGTFKDAIIPNIEVFSEFPQYAKKLKGMENKKIVMACTGGIRCEKASAYLKEHGFKKVYQLDGGIITYLKESAKHWNGKLFVFDERRMVE